MSTATGVVKVNILNPGFIQSQPYNLPTLESNNTFLENVELCFICSTEIEEGIIETVFSTDEIALHKVITESLGIEILPETKVLERLCKTCISHLEEFQELLLRLETVRTLLQVTYKRGHQALIAQDTNNSEFTLLKNGKESQETTYVIYQTISDDPDKMIEIIDDHPENYDELVHLTTTVNEIDPKSLFERIENTLNYICKQCPGQSTDNLVVYTYEAIQLHLLTEHNYSICLCNICDAVLNDTNDLNLHKISCHSEVPPLVPLSKDLRCIKCDKIFKDKQLFDDHNMSHKDYLRPFKCLKEGCNKDFSTKYTLTSHMKIHTDRPRPFKCNLCEKSFYHSQNLIQHRKLHSSTKEFICPNCNKAFSTQHNLDVHFIVHTKLKKFACAMCDKTFARKAEVRDHERTHTGEKPFGCSFCNATFAQRSNLLSHKRATHLNDKRHKCPQCDKGFKRRRLLDYHIKSTHTGERPFACDICSATFVIPEHYKKHLRIHSGSKPFNCELCKRSFSSKDNLKAHRFVHSKQRPYECVMCETGYMRKTLLFTHMKNMGHDSEHFIVNEPKIGEEGTIEIEKTLVRVDFFSEEHKKTNQK